MIMDPGLFARMYAAREGELTQAAECRRRHQEAMAAAAVRGRVPGWVQARLAAAFVGSALALARWAPLLKSLRARTPNRVSDCGAAPACCQASV